MDPLDRRLTDAGTAWRQAQPEPPDLNPMIAALPGRRSGFFEGRLMYAFIAGLLLVAAIAIAPGVGGFLHPVTTPLPPPSAIASPTPGPTESSTQPSPSSSAPSESPSASPSASLSDSDSATNLVRRYETALVAGNWAAAFDLLAPTSLTHQSGLAAFASERSAYFASVGGRYTLGAPARVTDWAGYGPTVTGADRSRAWLIEVDYPALAGNNAGFEQFVVGPDATGTWRIWPVR
jgi:hypothetical protein